MASDQLTVDSFYSEALKGKLLGLKCESGHVTVPPRHSCRVCQSTEMKPVELSGMGMVVSFTEVYVKAKEFPLDAPYTLALVGLEEGGNLLGVMRGPVKELKHGSRVSVKFAEAGSVKEKWPRIFFEQMI